MPPRPASPTGDDYGGGGAGTAQKLLRPRRRQQIEIWLDEAVHWEHSQDCAVGSQSPDHVPADLPDTPPPPPPPGPPSSSRPPSGPSSASQPAPPTCQVCGRNFTTTGEGKSRQPVPPAPSSSSSSPPPPPPGAPRDKGSKPGRARQMLRGVLSALRVTESSDREDDGVWDPALSTCMFLVEAANGGGGGSDSSAASRFSSDGGKQALNGRMARLRRAQRLLEKSQPNVG